MEEGRSLQQKELEINMILRGTEESWRLHNRAIWFSSGDTNTKFFHNFANFNRARKHIWEITNNERSKFTEPVAIKKTAFEHFKCFYKEQETPNMADKVKIAGIFPKIFKEEDSISLAQPVTMEELKSVIFKFKKSKSPSPDGWTSEFFTHFFDVVG